ncbi:MAG: hypothetical protein FWG75_02045 [Cystobacterineae bacterium]|nr:hypothetical protein [Cystobacterineae bacterium]
MQKKAVLFLWVIAFSAWAQQEAHPVVVLEFQADPGMRLSRQIESAIVEYAAMKPMSRQGYVKEAFRAGVVEAQTAEGFSRVAVHLKEVAIAVWGKIEGENVEITLLDRAGSPLWKRRLPLEKGLLTQALSQRLAKAVAAAVDIQTRSGAARKEREAPRAKAKLASANRSTKQAGSTLPSEATLAAQKRVLERNIKPQATASPPAEPVATGQEEVPGLLFADPLPAEARSRVTASSAFLRMALLGGVSWHSLCTRPGTHSCRAFDKLPMPRPTGSTVEFSAGAYGGALVQVEFFPLALLTASPWKGLGVRLEGGAGQATRDFMSEASVFFPQRRIREIHWSAEALYRHFFLKPSGGGLGLHASLSLGYAGKDFLSKDLPPEDFRRRYAQLGLDTELSLLSFMRLSLYAHFFIQPKPGKVAARAYGEASSIGYQVGGAVGGMIYGPLGYRLDASWNFFRDTFSGASHKWPVCDLSQCGGVAEESYFSLRGGLVLEF